MGEVAEIPQRRSVTHLAREKEQKDREELARTVGEAVAKSLEKLNEKLDQLLTTLKEYTEAVHAPAATTAPRGVATQTTTRSGAQSTRETEAPPEPPGRK